MKILIADDEVHILHAISFLFTKRGHEVHLAEDGETALQLARIEQPDLIFLDINMPRKSGMEVCEAIRSDMSLRDVPIYFLTGQGSWSDSRKNRPSPGHGVTWSSPSLPVISCRLWRRTRRLADNAYDAAADAVGLRPISSPLLSTAHPTPCNHPNNPTIRA